MFNLIFFYLFRFLVIATKFVLTLNWLRSEGASLTPAVHVVVNVEVFARLFVVVVVVVVVVVFVVVVVVVVIVFFCFNVVVVVVDKKNVQINTKSLKIILLQFSCKNKL
jgi:hypothetical protein